MQFFMGNKAFESLLSFFLIGKRKSFSRALYFCDKILESYNITKDGVFQSSIIHFDPVKKKRKRNKKPLLVKKNRILR